MRGTLIFTALLLAAPVALAQDEPTVNDSDYDTDPPADDQSYLDDAELESDTMSDSEFDTSVPAADESYLAEDADTEAGTDAGTGAGSSASGGDNTPGIALAVMLAALGFAALTWRRS